MELRLQNKRQVEIADMLWEAEDQASVDLVLKMFGHDAHVVHNMMVAAAMDQVTDTSMAEQALEKIFK